LQIVDHASGKAWHPAYDGNGNIAALVNGSTGTVAAVYEYSPAGELLRHVVHDSAAAGQPFRFSTKFTDDETGLVYYGRRYCSPNHGRFLGRDPIGEQGSLQLYALCANDSVNKWDVLGEYVEFTFAPNGNVTIRVPVIINSNNSDRAIAIQMLQNMGAQWSGHTVNGRTVDVHIDILTRTPSGSNYNVVNIHDQPGRSTVSPGGLTDRRTMDLFTSYSDGRTRGPNPANMPAHELGHVLGLEDQYRDRWTRNVDGKEEELLVNPGGGVPANEGWVFSGQVVNDGYLNRIMGNGGVDVQPQDLADVLSRVPTPVIRTRPGSPTPPQHPIVIPDLPFEDEGDEESVRLKFRSKR